MIRLQVGGETIACSAVLFDKDGTLIDFHGVWMHWANQVTARLRQEHNLPPEAAEQLLAAMGVVGGNRVDGAGPLAMAAVAEISAVLAGQLYRFGMTWVQARDAAHAAIAHVDSATDWAAASRLLPDVPLALERLLQAGLKLAVITADDGARARQTMVASGVSHLFGAILGADEVPRSKPYPDLVLEACKRLGVAPGEAIVIGDTIADMETGRRAGVARTIGVLTGVGSQTQLVGAGALIIESLAAINIA